MNKGMYIGKIIKTDKLAEDVFSMWIEIPQIVSQAKAGQFVSLFSSDQAHLLPRPISICEIDKENGRLRLVYRTVGYGTKEFSDLKKDDSIKIMGPLGNGFEIKGENPVLMGGGIGIPPMLEMAKQFKGKALIVLGYRDNQLFLKDEFEKYGKVLIATDDGSVGCKGNVIDALKETDAKKDYIYACGPLPMLRGIKEYGQSNNITTYLSMEEKMACGIGACLACVCKSKDKDEHSQVENKRVCKDGPVFLSTEVEI